jgi:hypothetical protein
MALDVEGVAHPEHGVELASIEVLVLARDDMNHAGFSLTAFCVSAARCFRWSRHRNTTQGCGAEYGVSRGLRLGDFSCGPA